MTTRQIRTAVREVNGTKEYRLEDMLYAPIDGPLPPNTYIYAVVPMGQNMWRLIEKEKLGWTFANLKGEGITAYRKTMAEAVLDVQQRWPNSVNVVLIEPE